MHGLIGCMRFFQAAHDKTGWRFPALVSLRLLGKLISCNQRHFEVCKLSMQFRIRQLRLLHLLGEFGQGGSHIAIASFLRSLEKPGDGSHAFRNCGRSIGPLGQDVHRLANLVRAEVHVIEARNRVLRTVLDQIAPEIKDNSEQGGAEMSHDAAGRLLQAAAAREAGMRGVAQ